MAGFFCRVLRAFGVPWQPRSAVVESLQDRPQGVAPSTTGTSAVDQPQDAARSSARVSLRNGPGSLIQQPTTNEPQEDRAPKIEIIEISDDDEPALPTPRPRRRRPRQSQPSRPPRPSLQGTPSALPAGYLPPFAGRRGRRSGEISRRLAYLHTRLGLEDPVNETTPRDIAADKESATLEPLSLDSTINNGINRGSGQQGSYTTAKFVVGYDSRKRPASPLSIEAHVVSDI
ncbi:uncharacterized protein NECHADRAFT_75811 [Fusarium vanettenii 77-13-4]|uniref:Uncharacterized protein n=1 Tax=Fusarium vanettenii (strain ATCC MYA-4622 / CBS 123669 / FGSC 9596 / NRRL 45880 / 77-13-4) TaxID=660122 RepID=C7Z5N3_FUSV7|nr:uncharacterized protein NECHADRAFT_75811 [Fusarium vanettenii 77-13-4]EEU40554.1 predicted protein [Fusarium vanettenii 77-13-4]